MANYSEIKRVVPSQRHPVMVVGGNWKLEEWECITRGRRKDWEVEKRSSNEIRWRERTREQDGSRPPSLSTVRRDAQGPTIVWGRVARVGLGCLGAVSQCPGGAPYHYYGLARIENSEVFFVLLSLLSFCFVIIIKYSRAQEGNQALYPHHHSSLLL